MAHLDPHDLRAELPPHHRALRLPRVAPRVPEDRGLPRSALLAFQGGGQCDPGGETESQSPERTRAGKYAGGGEWAVERTEGPRCEGQRVRILLPLLFVAIISF